MEKGEKEQGYGLWEVDLYGVGSVLVGKREKRGWDKDALEMLGRAEEETVLELLEWRGGADGKEVYNGRLPWDI